MSSKYAIGKFTFIVLNLDMNPSIVDVNVHPSKLEVKFENESKVFDAVYHAIKNALEEDATKNSPFTTIRDSKIEHEKQAEPQIKPIIQPNIHVENVDKSADILPKSNVAVQNEVKNDIKDSSLKVEEKVVEKYLK